MGADWADIKSAHALFGEWKKPTSCKMVGSFSGLSFSSPGAFLAVSPSLSAESLFYRFCFLALVENRPFSFFSFYFCTCLLDVVSSFGILGPLSFQTPCLCRLFCAVLCALFPLARLFIISLIFPLDCQCPFSFYSAVIFSPCHTFCLLRKTVFIVWRKNGHYVN